MATCQAILRVVLALAGGESVRLERVVSQPTTPFVLVPKEDYAPGVGPVGAVASLGVSDAGDAVAAGYDNGEAWLWREGAVAPVNIGVGDGSLRPPPRVAVTR